MAFINNPPNGNGIVGPTAGAVTAARDGRDIQLALKVSFYSKEPQCKLE